MNLIQIKAFVKFLKTKKNGTTKQRRKLVAKTDYCFNNNGVIVDASILQQRNNNDQGKISVR